MTQAPAPGTPIWVDLGTKDLDASRSFYGQLFGWDSQPGPPEAGGYTFFFKNGKMVAGVGPLMNEQQPSAWSTYVHSQDADATTRAVRDAGGQVLVEPMDVMTAGRFAVYMDPSGAAISVWQPREHRGAELVNEPGSLCWNELQTRDLGGAKGFYPRVFGWQPKSNSMGEMGEYVEWQVDGRSIAGAMTMAPQTPAQVPSFWLTYFAVEDCEAAVARAGQLGGQVRMGCTDSPAGRFAVLADPQGGTFAVISLAR
jgi:predicted enzyme related to lactoylglutathione lyase